MSSPVCPDDWNKANFGSSVCDVLTELIRTNDKLKLFFSWMFDPQCKISPEFVREFLEVFSPIGTTFWSPVVRNDTDFVQPSQVWVLCNGQSLARDGAYAKLFAIFGTTFGSVDSSHFNVPDLQGRTIVGKGTANNGGTINRGTSETHAPYGGSDNIELAEGAVPVRQHKHAYAYATLANPDAAPSDWAEFDEDDGLAFRLATAVLDTEAANGAVTDMYTGSQPFQVSSGFTHAKFITSEPVDFETTGTLKGVGFDPAPPYVAGAFYIRANHKLNGVIL